MIEFLGLGGGQTVLGIAEVATGIHHLRIQPQGVEVVGQVVVIGNGFGIHLPIMLGAFHRRTGQLAEQPLAQPIRDLDDIHDVALNIHALADVGVAQLVEGRGLHVTEQVRIIDEQGNPGILGEIESRSPLHHHPQRQLQSSQGFGKLREHPPISCIQ